MTHCFLLNDNFLSFINTKYTFKGQYGPTFILSTYHVYISVQDFTTYPPLRLMTNSPKHLWESHDYNSTIICMPVMQ